MYNNAFAPIALFVYNRLLHTQKTIEALKCNVLASESQLYIYSDGGKDDVSYATVEILREYLKSITGFKSVNIILREKNYGLANNIISGVEEVLKTNKKIIVLEDDIVPSIGFLTYMNDALNMYLDNEAVACIHAWNYHLDDSNYKDSTFFLKGADCWGWATWDTSWKLFNTDGEYLLRKIKEKQLEFAFNRRNTHDFTTMLEDNIKGLNNSWAVRWHASLILENKYCLHPTRSIVKNIGLDNSGTHCGPLDLDQNPVNFIAINGIKVEENDWFFSAFTKLRKRKYSFINSWQRSKISLRRLFRR